MCLICVFDIFERAWGIGQEVAHLDSVPDVKMVEYLRLLLHQDAKPFGRDVP